MNLQRQYFSFTLAMTIGLTTTLLLAGCGMPQQSAFASTAAASADAPVVETEAPSSETYDWRGTKLTISLPLPESPAEAGIFVASPDTHATLETAQALADQLGLQGEIYEVPSELGHGSNDFLIVDGNQRLRIRSDRYFSYYPNFAQAYKGLIMIERAQAESLINEFLQAHAFDFEFKVELSDFYGAYYALPLATDGIPFRHQHFKANGFLFTFNEAGIASVEASLIASEPIGQYGIVTAEEALQKLLDPATPYGILEGGHSSSEPYQEWYRVYPKDQTVTFHGWMDSIRSLDGGAQLVTLDGYTVTGNLTGIEEDMPGTFVEVTGQFHSEDSVDGFVLESWEVYGGFAEGWVGTLRREGEEAVLITTEGAAFILPEVPSDVPLPLEDVYVMGVALGEVIEWNAFDMRFIQGGGGGGGGGLGFYKINLSGTPIPLPTPMEAPRPPQIGDRIEGERSLVYVTLYNQPDGSQRAEYSFHHRPDGQPMVYPVLLEGADLTGLQAYQGRPIEIWGTIDRYNDQLGSYVVAVERLQIPFPDLQLQILRGTQETVDLDGQSAILFSVEDGETYVQLSSVGDLDAYLLIGVEGDLVNLEVLVIPSDTYGGYPTVRVFGGGLAFNPDNGQPFDMVVTADQPYVMDEPTADQLQEQENYVAPSAIIETVELVYFIVDPRHVSSDPSLEPSYIQPVWRFYGHYSNGDEFEILIQALRAEFLSPEIQLIEGPG